MQAIKEFVKRVLPRSIRNRIYTLWALRYSHPSVTERARYQCSPEWRVRTDDVLSCPDNRHIQRHPDAGNLKDGLLTMHNGVRVGGLGYYGAGMMNLLMENRGVHEPQEERAFCDLLACLPADATMLELGAYWGFYSLWFSQVVQRPRTFLVEPNFGALLSGKQNFLANGRNGTFENAFVGIADAVAPDGTPTTSVDSFCLRHRIDHLNVLHADIQGAEAEMLAGAKSMLVGKRIDYLVISTHSNELHYQCCKLLESNDYSVLVSVDLDETYSVDGMIFAKRGTLPEPSNLQVSKRSPRPGERQPC